MSAIKLTKKRKAHYVTSPFHCPFCKSENIEAQDFDVSDDGNAKQDIVCLECERMWKDCYKLVDVEEAKDE